MTLTGGEEEDGTVPGRGGKFNQEFGFCLETACLFAAAWLLWGTGLGSGAKSLRDQGPGSRPAQAPGGGYREEGAG